MGADDDPHRRRRGPCRRAEAAARTRAAIHGSARLGQSLLAAGLIDEIRLAIAPVVVGRGRRLFPDGGAPSGLRLVDSRTTAGGIAVHVYVTTGRPTYATYGPPS